MSLELPFALRPDTEVAKASTIVMNGPMGVFEFPSFAEGSRSLMSALVDATAAGSDWRR